MCLEFHDMEEVVGSVLTSKKQVFSKSYFLPTRQLTPVESSVGSAHRRISIAPVLPCLPVRVQTASGLLPDAMAQLKEDQDAAISVAD